MGNRSDRLHFDCVHFFERMVKDSWGINGLETEHFVVEVADKKRLGRERIGLDINIRSRDVLQET